MKRFVLVLLFLLLSLNAFSQSEENIVGIYKDVSGNTIEITSTTYILNGKTAMPIMLGQRSSTQNFTMFGGISYYIKPSYTYDANKATLTNILLQNGDNQILGVNIFDYDTKTQTLKYITWDIISVSMLGVSIQEFKRIE